MPTETKERYDEIEVQRANGNLERCEVMMWDGERNNVVLLFHKRSGMTFLAKRKLGAWVELSWLDVMRSVSRDIEFQRHSLRMMNTEKPPEANP